MNSQHVRIFLTTSQICTVYATMLAKETHAENDVDILFIDGSKRRPGLIQQITVTSSLYNWALFHDFSIVMGEDYDFEPSFTKNFIRRIKTLPIVRNVYRILLQKHFKSIDKHYRHELSKQLQPFLDSNTKVSLFMLTQTYLNQPLSQLFPNASINYIEHGMGDYYFMLDPNTPKGNFYCLFATTFSAYLAKQGKPNSWVKQLPGYSSFTEFANVLLNDKGIVPGKIIVPDQPSVFILLEAVDAYNVKNAFWSEYLDHVFAQLDDPGHYHFFLKPHPMQSEKSLIETKRHMDAKGYSYTLIDQPNLINASAEILFNLWKKNTEHVFCLISSSCYYLSKLYASEKITFWYSTEFLSRYVQNAPPLFLKLFVEIRPLIENVLTENCKRY
jgi:hypothetical protein